MMVTFIDQHRDLYGVEPICALLPIAPSTYFLQKVHDQDATTRSARRRRDDDLRAAIQRVWDANEQVYGPRKVWKQLRRDGRVVARCTVERLMRAMGLRGVSRGRAWKITTHADPAGARPTDLVDRQFTATRPNQLWVADFTYVATWRGFVYVAFVIDVFARRIVGWRVSASLATDFVLDALEQAIYDRRAGGVADLVHHSDRGTQYLSMRYTERLRSAAAAIRTTTRWPNRSSVSSRRRSFSARDRGDIMRASNSPHSPGWIGSTRADCSNRLATCRPQNMRFATTSSRAMPQRSRRPILEDAAVCLRRRSSILEPLVPSSLARSARPSPSCLDPRWGARRHPHVHIEANAKAAERPHGSLRPLKNEARSAPRRMIRLTHTNSSPTNPGWFSRRAE
jgi:putative transposase